MYLQCNADYTYFENAGCRVEVSHFRNCSFKASFQHFKSLNIKLLSEIVKGNYCWIIINIFNHNYNVPFNLFASTWRAKIHKEE